MQPLPQLSRQGNDAAALHAKTSGSPTGAPATTCQDGHMTRFISTWFVSSLALAFAALLLGDRMNIGGDGEDLANQALAVAIVGLIFTIINLLIAPIVKLLSLPFIIITFGLLLLVINAALLLLTEWVSTQFGVEFFIDGFWWAVLASVVISISQSILAGILGQD